MDKTSYHQKHQELILISEHTNVLLWQMKNKKYADVTTFINNLNHLERYQEVILMLSKDSVFWQWFKENDTDLFIHTEAIQLSFGILDNLIENLRNAFLLFKKESESSSAG